MVCTYKGVDIYSMNRNSSGLRYYAYALRGGKLRADTLAGIKQLIKEDLKS